jgi:hypothetical protein
MSVEGWLASIFGFVFVSLSAGVAIWITATNKTPNDQAMFLFRVVIALAAAGVGAFVPGTLDVAVDAPGVAIRATAGLALFLIIYWKSPPALVAHPKPEPVVGPIIHHTKKPQSR